MFQNYNRLGNEAETEIKKKKKKQVVTIMRTRSKQGTRVCNLSVPRLTMALYEFLILIQIKQPFSVLLLKNR